MRVVVVVEGGSEVVGKRKGEGGRMRENKREKRKEKRERERER